MKKIFISIATIAAVLFISITASAQTAKETVKKAVIKVVNLHCKDDMPTIKKQLLNQDGIETVAFTSLTNESSVFTISYMEGVTSQEQIEKVIEATPGCDDKSTTPYKVRRDTKKKKA